jgi:hypothetical protein
MIVELAIKAQIGGFGPRIVTLGFYTGRLSPPHGNRKLYREVAYLLAIGKNICLTF